MDTNTTQGSQVRLVIADKFPCATCGKEVYAEKVPYVCHDCWKNGKAGEAIADLEVYTLKLEELLEAYIQAHDAAQIGLDECECDLCRQARPLLKVQS
jgi:hypothetical protein